MDRILTDEVAEAEQDDFLAIFSHRPVRNPDAQRWMNQWIEQECGTMQNVEDMEGYEEMTWKFLDSMPVARRLEGIPPEERLAGIPPAERLAGLAPEEQLLALSDEVLRGLPDEYLRTLPVDVQAAIRAASAAPDELSLNEARIRLQG